MNAFEGVIAQADPLSLDISDDDLDHVLDTRIDTATKFYEKHYNLTEKRNKNEVYYLGHQVSDAVKASKYRPYEARYQDNAIYEIEASIKPVALSRMPDLIVLPGDNTEEQKQTAEQLSKIIDSEIKTRNIRRVVGMAFKQLPIYYTGVIKAIWNPELGDYGDYEFVNVHPKNIVFDEHCPINDADYMEFVAESVKKSVQKIVMMFPKKETEFLAELKKQGVSVKEGDDWKQMATEVQLHEVWFTWYKKAEGDKWERIEGVLWKFGHVILKKIKNPNYDYEGKPTYFTYDEQGNKTPSTSNEMMAMAIGPSMGLPTPNVQQETVYRNYFEMPRKPYFFMGYDQLGKTGLDETSRIEQNIYNQENIDQIGKRIIEKLKDRGKHIFSKESGLSGKDLERMDINNPDQDILAEGDVNKVHGYIQPLQPTQQEFAEIKMARERMFTLAGATNLSGVLQTDVATSNQIAREANFSRIDDLTEETVNSACEWIAGWAMQFIKLRYTEEHMRKVLGDKGVVTFTKLKSDMISDGMEVKIKASGTDKQKRRANAMDMAKLKLIDPITFFEDMDLNDPRGRAEKLLMLQSDPQGYIMKYVMQMTPEQGAAQLQNAPIPGQPPQPELPAAEPYINPPQTNPSQPVPGNTAQVAVQPPMNVTASPQGQ